MINGRLSTTAIILASLSTWTNIVIVLATDTCPPMNSIVNHDVILNQTKPYIFPPEIYRPKPGVLDVQCNQSVLLQLNVPWQGHQRDPTFCLPGPGGVGSRCDRCAPQESNLFKYPFWSDYLKIKSEGSKERKSVAHCLTCYAHATKYPGALANGDYDKGSVTVSWAVSTRLACGKYDGKKFPLPNAKEIEKLEKDIEKLQKKLSQNPCSIQGLPICTQAFGQQIISMTEELHNTTMKLQNYIESFVHETPDGEIGDGHHETLMEIPYGKTHLLQAQISVEDDYAGYSDAEKILNTTGYITSEGKTFGGCMAYEYGMAAVSPGIINSACWLTPMYNDEKEVTAWAENERKLEKEIQEKQKKATQNLVSEAAEQAATLCKSKHMWSANPVMQQAGNSYCQNIFCRQQQVEPVKHRWYNDICATSQPHINQPQINPTFGGATAAGSFERNPQHPAPFQQQQFG